MKILFKVSFIFFLLFVADNLYAQIGVTYYTTNIMAVNTGKNHKVNGELKLFAVKDIEELPLEIDAYYNFSLHEMYRVSLGAGFKVEVLTCPI